MKKGFDRVVSWIETANEHIGRAMGWLMFLLVVLVTIDVVSRYLFHTGAVFIQETEWWMFSIIFLMGAGYTFLHDGHVRVDIIYARLPDKWKNWVDLGCAFLFLFPMCVLVAYTSFFFIRDSWNVREFSPDPGGLPAYYVLKAFIPIGFFFLALQGVAEVYKIVQRLRGVAEPKQERKAF